VRIWIMGQSLFQYRDGRCGITHPARDMRQLDPGILVRGRFLRSPSIGQARIRKGVLLLEAMTKLYPCGSIP